MQAAVLRQVNTPIVVEEVELDQPHAGEVLVRLVASGVCHSCLHIMDGSMSWPVMPVVLGDEGAGVVERVGAGVSSVAVGDHVILSWSPACGRCRYCATGRPQLCERGQAVTNTARGCFARESDSGDSRANRRTRSRVHRGRSRQHRAIQQAWDALAPGGTCVVIGAPPPGETIAVNPACLYRDEKRLTGSRYGSSRPLDDFGRFVDLYLGGKLELDALITREYSLGDVNEAHRALAAGENMRGLIVF